MSVFTSLVWQRAGTPSGAAAASPPTHVRRLPHPNPLARRLPAPAAPCRATIKFKDYDGVGLQLDPACREELEGMLSGIADQVRGQAQMDDSVTLEFSGHLFEPVPWSPSTPKGMPSVSFAGSSAVPRWKYTLYVGTVSPPPPPPDVHSPFSHIFAGDGGVYGQPRPFDHQRSAASYVQSEDFQAQQALCGVQRQPAAVKRRCVEDSTTNR